MRNIGTIKIAAASSATTSAVFTNNVCDTCALQIWGTASAFKVQLQGMVDAASNAWVSIASYDKDDLTVVDGTTGMTSAGIFTVDVSGVRKIRINLASVSGGNVNVTAALADTSSN